MKPSEMRYILEESVAMLWRRKAANSLSMIIMGLSLLILIVFLMVTLNIAALIGKTSEEMRLYVYLEDGLTEERVEEIRIGLMSENGVDQVLFVSKDEALEDFRESLGEGSDLLDALDGNPLPDAFRVKVRQENVRSDSLAALAARAGMLGGVEETRYGKQWFEKGERLVRGFYVVDLVIGVIVLLSVIFVISNTVRLTILNSKDSIDIMKLVGATNSFIQIPFIIEGALQGAVSSLLAVGLLAIVFKFAEKYLPGLVFIRLDAISSFVVFCAILGAAGSYAAMRKFLKI